MAKPTPSLPPDCDRIDELTPITWPVGIEQRSARVAGVDGGVGLDRAAEQVDLVAWHADSSPGLRRALTMPSVTVCCRPSGEPMAIAVSPTVTWSESPRVTGLMRSRIGSAVADRSRSGRFE